MTNRQIWMPYILHCLYNGHPDVARIHIGNYLRQVARIREGGTLHPLTAP